MSVMEHESLVPSVENDGSRAGFYVDYIAGCIGGMVGTVVGQPFDTVKVRLQTESKMKLYKNGIDCLQTVLRKEGVYGPFKGLTPPIAGQAGINAVIFGVQGTVMRFMSPGIKSEITSGVLAGGSQTLIACPVELIKTHLQLQGKDVLHKNVANFQGPFGLASKIIKDEGIFGLYRGMRVTLLRDAPAFGIYFGVYFAMMKLLTLQGKTADDIGPLQIMFAGGTAGVASWVYSYPIDVIKSKIQAEGFLPGGRYKGYVDCIKTSIDEGGYRVFTRGMAVCLTRAFPVNAATFVAVEFSLGILNPQRIEKFSE